MKNIRTNVFETNSSSSHSISISDGDELRDTILPDENGVIHLRGGEFGWEWETYNSAESKANYCAIDCQNDLNMIKMLVEVIKEHTGARDVLFEFGKYSYIDHQSQGTSYDAFRSKEELRRFLFDRNSYIETGNDNG